MLQVIMLFAPGCVAALIYERFCKCNYSTPRLAFVSLGFALIINLLAYVAILLRDHVVINWTYSGDAANVAFCVKYMVLSLVFAVLLDVLAIGLNNMKAGKKND